VDDGEETKLRKKTDLVVMAKNFICYFPLCEISFAVSVDNHFKKKLNLSESPLQWTYDSVIVSALFFGSKGFPSALTCKSNNP
jgi:hypothetical protein